MTAQMAFIARSEVTKQSRCRILVRHCGLRWLHHRLDDVRTDLLSHLAAGYRREAVMEAGANAGVGDLIAENPKIGEVMRDSKREGARQCQFGELVAAEQRFDYRSNGRTQNAVSARIFRVHRCCVDRLPGGVALRGGITVDVAVTYCRNRTPELVFVLGV